MVSTMLNRFMYMVGKCKRSCCARTYIRNLICICPGLRLRNCVAIKKSFEGGYRYGLDSRRQEVYKPSMRAESGVKFVADTPPALITGA